MFGAVTVSNVATEPFSQLLYCILACFLLLPYRVKLYTSLCHCTASS